jgi:hypothetical protein
VRTFVGSYDAKPFGLQRSDGFPQKRPAHAQRIREFDLDDAVTGAQASREDQFPYLLHDFVDEQPWCNPDVA